MNYKKLSILLLVLFIYFVVSSCTTEIEDGLEMCSVDTTTVGSNKEKEEIDGGFLAGKTFSVLGNSISTYSGCIPSGFRNYYSSKYFSVDDTWWMQFSSITGAKLLSNASWSGSTVAYTGKDIWNSYFYSDTRIGALGSNGRPDLIIVIGGTNDWGLRPCDLGVYPSEDTLTFIGAYSTMLKKLKLQYKESVILCSSILPRSQGVNNYNSKGWSISIANKYVERLASDNDCLFVNMDECGINNPSSSYMFDSVHPNALGMKLIAEAFAAFLKGKYCDEVLSNY
jgi:lysophospholipase L1-like esterase